MKVLQLCKKFPFPLKDGESIAINYLTKAMYELGAEITLLSMNTTKHYVDIKTIPATFDHYKAIYTTDLDNYLKPVDAFINLFSSQSYHISRYVDTSFTAQLIELLQQNEYDIVQLETLYLASYTDIIRTYSKAKIVMRSHNVEHEIWDRVAENTSNIVKKSYLKILTKRLKTFEIDKLNSYDALLAITNRDMILHQQMGFKKQSIAVPIGIDTAMYAQKSKPFQSKITMGFIGSLDWQPNIEGLQWFLKAVWPTILEQFQHIELHIAGRNTPDWIAALSMERIVIHGDVPNAQDFINAHNIMIVPLLSGGGMRVKIIEGMALGRVIITTSIGIEGIDAIHKNQVLIANETQDFVDAISYCYAQNENLNIMGQKAQQYVQENYDSSGIGKKVMNFYDELCEKYPNQSRTFAE